MGNGSKKMRRRSRMKVLKILQSFSQGTFIAFVLLLLYFGQSLAEPGYLDFDNLPETNFTCAGKVIGGYYADLEASCQMFHVCTIGQGDEPMDIKFLCLNGTVFDQETRVCERVDEVDCSKSERFYYLNLELYGNTIIPAPDESSSEEASGSPSSMSTTASTTTTSTTTTTTRRPTTTTPSRRFIFNNSKGSSIVPSTTPVGPSHSYSTSTPKTPVEEDEYEYEDDEYEEKEQAPGVSPSLPAIEEDGTFSPQQFTLQQQTQNSQQNAPQDDVKTHDNKPAVSFQQQHFQNGGTLAVTNSHVTVTTHTTTSNTNPNNSNTLKKNAQQFLTQKETKAIEHQKQQQQQQLLQQQMLTKQHEELQKKQQEAAVQQQQKAIQQQQKQVQQHESEIKNHQALLLLHQQKITRQQQKQPHSSSRPPSAPAYNPYVTINSQQQKSQTHAPKRIPLLPAEAPLESPTAQPQQPLSAAQLAPFRLRAQGFKLPSQQQSDMLEQEDRFEGYRRQQPPQLRNQKDISLEFDPEQEDLTQIPQHKELKRSDPPFHSSIHGDHTPPPITTKGGHLSPQTSPTAASQPSASTAISADPNPTIEPASYGQEDAVEYEYDDYSSAAGSDAVSNPSLDSAKSNTNSEIVVAGKHSGEDHRTGHRDNANNGKPGDSTGSSNSYSSSSNDNSSNSSRSKTNTSRFIINNEHHKSPTSSSGSGTYSRGRSGRVFDSRSAGTASHKVRTSYHPQTPKVIVTTSTSIRDNNGRTINYSISSSNSSPTTASPIQLATNDKPTSTRGYDEYKEDDVLSDPFFLDVPKVGGGAGRRKRSISTQRKRRKRFIFVVPRFL
ncbi:formin-J-like isoform X2 [Toxorhynchites rutilus septentrionalis]|uniref:formin-J-like isoform X2 n=1 Tax=Toxorhynchites rutilus septentrionalis TaxID=329112 RepID=UPI002478AC5F|nr:formin-J-like isoform X2 [Toxorhynchites rutilus septentrionalis]